MSSIDPITGEEIAEELRIEVDGIAFSLETLYNSYIHSSKMENPFNRQPLEEHIQERILEYSKTKLVSIRYLKRYSEFSENARICEVIKIFIRDDKDFYKNDMFFSGKSLFAMDLSLCLKELGCKKLAFHKQGKLDFETRQKFCLTLMKDFDYNDGVILTRMLGKRKARELVEREFGEEEENDDDILMPDVIRRIFQDMGTARFRSGQLMDIQGVNATPVVFMGFLPMGGELNIADARPPVRRELFPPIPPEEYDYEFISSILAGADDDEIIKELEENMDPERCNPVEFYYSLLGLEGRYPENLLAKICEGEQENLRRNLLGALWLGKGLVCTKESFVYLSILHCSNERIRRNRKHLMKKYLEDRASPDLDLQYVDEDVQNLVIMNSVQ